MQDISDKDSLVFALNKQLTSLKTLLQSSELMMNNSYVFQHDNASMLNQSAMNNLK
jgi:hypothetical protein